MGLYDWLILTSIAAPFLMAVIVVFTGQQANLNAQRSARASERIEADLVLRDAELTRMLQSIHQLTNARLSEALSKIDSLEARLYQITGESPSGEPARRVDADG